MYLQVNLHSNSGIVICCEHSTACKTYACKCCQNYASIEINIIECEYISGRNSFSEVDRTLLHEPFTKDMLLHDPYTPESIESHSPQPNDQLDIQPPDFSLRKQSVSPQILKSRLEIILRSEIDAVKPFKQRLQRHLTKSQSQQLDSRPENEFVYSRARCMSESAKKNSRAKLISLNSAQSKLRLESHHSSSDEDWFEFEESATKDTHLLNEVFAENIKTKTVTDEVDVLLTEDNNKNIEKKNKLENEAFCCCVVS